MKALLVAFLTAMVAQTASAEDKVLAHFSWKDLAQAGSGEVTTLPDGRTALKIENTLSKPLHTTVITILPRTIASSFYWVSGQVKTENIEGDGYLEMWNHFDANEAYFSRTLGDSGPMGKLHGTADWRDFALPFDAAGAKSPVQKLVINVHLPARGVVYLSELTLAESAASSRAWWSQRTAGLIGGIGGATVGCLAAAASLFASRGRAQRFVTISLGSLIALGGVSLVVGVVAIIQKQPYGVWYGPLLLGFILVTVLPYQLRAIQKRYRDGELRRISSMDAAAR